MTADRDVDVLGYFPREERDPIRIMIDNLLDQYGETLITYIKMKQAERSDADTDRAAIAARGVLWPKWTCKRG